MRHRLTPLAGVATILVATVVASGSTAAAGARAAVVPKNFYPASVTFVTDSDAWALGTAPCGKKFCSAVVHTVDRGRAWTKLPSPAGKPGSIAFATANDGYLLLRQRSGKSTQRRLFVTHDAGRDWSALSISIGRPISVATNGSDVFVVVKPSRGSEQLLEGAVGGSCLRVLGAVHGRGLTVQGDSAYIYPTATGEESSHPLTLGVWDGSRLTSDPLPCGNGDRWAADLAASSPTHLALICGSQPGTGDQIKQVFTSANSGRQWTQVPAPPENGYIASAAATTAGTFFTGGRSGIVATRNRGKYWKTSEAKYIDSGFRFVGFTDAGHGVALLADGQSSLLLTNDAGHNWFTRRF